MKVDALLARRRGSPSVMCGAPRLAREARLKWDRREGRYADRGTGRLPAQREEMREAVGCVISLAVERAKRQGPRRRRGGS